MRDGWYLSTYLTQPGIPRLLGVWPRHDNNASLWRKRGRVVTLVRNWEIERLSRIKQHGAAFATVSAAWDFLDGLLRAEGVRRDELRAVWGTPGLAADPAYPRFAEDLPVTASRTCIPAVSHLDDSARIQTLDAGGGSLLRTAVGAFAEVTLLSLARVAGRRRRTHRGLSRQRVVRSPPRRLGVRLPVPGR